MIQKTLKRKTQRSQMMSSTGKQFFQKPVGYYMYITLEVFHH